MGWMAPLFCGAEVAQPEEERRDVGSEAGLEVVTPSEVGHQGTDDHQRFRVYFPCESS